MLEEIWSYIRRCVVRLQDKKTGERGSGFFVGPGHILTAKHVAPSGEAKLFWNGIESDAESIPLAIPQSADAVLLKTGITSHPILKLGRPPSIRELVRVVGFPYRAGVQHEETITAEIEDDQFQHPEEPNGVRLLKFKGGQTVAGASGSPLIRESTMEAVGIVSDSRDQRSDLGGMAVPTEFLIRNIPRLQTLQMEALWDETPWQPEAFQRDGVLRNYFDFYLAPLEPFFGRAAEIEALTSWLDNDVTAPYALLTARAGSGKSSLLAHWFESLLRRRDVRSGALDVIFIPISIRFDFCTEPSVLRRLALRLASTSAKLRAQVDQANVVHDLRACVTNLLREPPEYEGRRLVILDGIDEGVGWEVGAGLMPSAPGARTKVLLAARELASRDQNGWRNHLAWSSPELAQNFTVSSLTQPQVIDAVESWWGMAPPSPLGAQLYELTDGDPLVLGLYFSSSGRASPPGSLSAVAPGIEGFFKRWWTEQEKQWGKKRGDALGRTGKLVLNVLAGAFEPLTRMDLLQICRQLTEDFDGDSLDEGLQALERFVVGTPSFVLSHPRLARSRWEALVADGDHAAIEDAFLAWSERATMASSKKPSAPVSRYSIRCFRKHLDRAAVPVERWRPISIRRWREAWEEQDDWRDGYLQDIHAAGEKFATADRAAVERHEPIQFLSSECEIAWRRGLVDLFEKRVGAAFTRELVRYKIWRPERGVEHVRATQRGAEVIAGLAMLAPWLDAPLFERALTTIQSLDTYSLEYKESLLIEALVQRGFEIDRLQSVRLWLATLTKAGGVAGHLSFAERSGGSARRSALAGALGRLQNATPFNEVRLALFKRLSANFSVEEVTAALGLKDDPDVDELRLALGLITKAGAPMDAFGTRVLWPWLNASDRPSAIDRCFDWIARIRGTGDPIPWISEVGPLADIGSEADVQRVWNLLKLAIENRETFLEEAMTVAFRIWPRLTGEQQVYLVTSVPMAVDAACHCGHNPTAVVLAVAIAQQNLAGLMVEPLMANATNRWTAPDIFQAIAPYLTRVQINTELGRLGNWRGEDRDPICGTLLGVLAGESADSARELLRRAGTVFPDEGTCLQAMLASYEVGAPLSRSALFDSLRAEPDVGTRQQLILLFGPRMAPWTIDEIRNVTAGLERPDSLITGLLPFVNEDELYSGAIHGFWSDSVWPDFDGDILIRVIRRIASERGVEMARRWALEGERKSGHEVWRRVFAAATAPLATPGELRDIINSLQGIFNEHLQVAGFASVLQYLPKEQQDGIWGVIRKYLSDARPPHRGLVATVLRLLPGERRLDAEQTANIDAMFEARGSVNVWVSEFAALMPWASRQAVDKLLSDTNEFSRLDSGGDRDELRAAVAPRLLELGDAQRAFAFARQIAGPGVWRTRVAMLPFVRTREHAYELARVCIGARLESVLAVARDLAAGPASNEVQLEFVSTILASVSSQREAVVFLTALCPLIVLLGKVSALQPLAAIME